MRAAAILLVLGWAACAHPQAAPPPDAFVPAPVVPKRPPPPWPVFEPASVPPPPVDEPAQRAPEPGDHAALEDAPPVANAPRTVAAMAPDFRRCYNRALYYDAGMRGSFRITGKIAATGEVITAVPSGGGGLSPQLERCLVNVVLSRRFTPPEGGGATIVIPITLQPQDQPEPGQEP